MAVITQQFTQPTSPVTAAYYRCACAGGHANPDCADLSDRGSSELNGAADVGVSRIFVGSQDAGRREASIIESQNLCSRVAIFQRHHFDSWNQNDRCLVYTEPVLGDPKWKSQLKPFSRLRRRLAVAILTLGLVTFFVPLFSISPPVLGSASWSALNLVSGSYAQRFPRVEAYFNLALSGVLLVYSLMLCGLVALAFPNPQKALVTVGVIGSIAGYDPFYWGHQEFAHLLFRSGGICPLCCMSR
jgi:hypothetical protein